MNDVQVSQKEYDELIKYKDSLRRILTVEHGDTFFISGVGGETDKNGLPDAIWICPAMGVDWSVIYKKEKK